MEVIGLAEDSSLGGVAWGQSQTGVGYGKRVGEEQLEAVRSTKK